MAIALSWFLLIGTPVFAVLFLTCFLVNMGQWGAETAFTRFCQKAQLPAFGLCLICAVLTLRYF
ncbi:hypothetical protein [Jannaschia sp. 2305UL9-9]|uniref:hypothetical protein n=1 Tax=Jannaschia sp. 2305UL9-9 TaxID=3121638 RepID=UPI003528D740